MSEHKYYGWNTVVMVSLWLLLAVYNYMGDKSGGIDPWHQHWCTDSGRARISVQEGQDCKMKLTLKILINIKYKKKLLFKINYNEINYFLISYHQ